MISDEEIIKRLIELSPFSNPDNRPKLTRLFKETCNLGYNTIEDMVNEKKKLDSCKLEITLKDYQESIRKKLMGISHEEDDDTIEVSDLPKADKMILKFVYSLIGYRLCKLYIDRDILEVIYAKKLPSKEINSNFFTAQNDFEFRNEFDEAELKDLLKEKAKLHLYRAAELWEKHKYEFTGFAYRFARAAKIYLMLHQLEPEKYHLATAWYYANEAKNIITKKHKELPYLDKSLSRDKLTIDAIYNQVESFMKELYAKKKPNPKQQSALFQAQH